MQPGSDIDDRRLLILQLDWRKTAETGGLFATTRSLRFIIDEVHCIFDIDEEFRPAYSKLGIAKAHFPLVPWLGLTATAALEDATEIARRLGMANPTQCVLMGNVHRPELRIQHLSF